VSEAVLERFERYQWPGNVRELKNLVRRLIATAVTFPVTLADLPPVLGRSTESSSASADHPGQEQELLMEVVASARTMAEAAARLGITRSTLYRRMERFGLRPERVLRRN
jgi:transcriptional regulator of acetoin/glycerol metabolism